MEEFSFLMFSSCFAALFVNFDPQILALIREAEMMVKLELEIPPLMRELLKQQGLLKKTRDDLVVCAS